MALMRGRNVIVFPTGISAATKADYFSVFVPYMEEHNIVSAVMLYPADYPAVIRNAKVLTDQASLFPVLVKNSFIGGEDNLPIVKLVFSSVVRTAPDSIHIVTSGGSGKMVSLAVLIGNLADKFGIDPNYLWAAQEGNKDNKEKKFVIGLQPKIIIKSADKYSVKEDNKGDIIITRPS